MIGLISLTIYLIIMLIVLRILRTTKYSLKFKSWVYGLAMPSSFLTGWAFIGMSDFFIRQDLTFISFYFGIILFSPIVPLVIEKINRVVIQKDINDIVSFIHKNFFSDKIIKISSFLLVLIIGSVYIFINLKSLYIILGENFYIFIISLVIILSFILLLKDWDIITSVAFQGIVMLTSFGIISLFFCLKHFESISSLFEEMLKTANSKLIVNNSSFISQWNINLLTTIFAYLFLPRQFSLFIQARELPSKVKGIRIILVSTIFFLLYIFFDLILSSIFYLKVGYINIKIIDFVSQYGILFSIVFFISGASFILSTFNQQVIAFSKIFENNLNINKYIPLSFFVLLSISLFSFLESVHINTLGIFCFSSLFTLITPVIFILYSKDTEKFTNPARISLIVSLIAALIMLISLISDPNSFSIPKEENELIKIIKSLSINRNYFFSLFIYSNIISLILFSIEKYAIYRSKKIKTREISFDYLSIIDKISSFFDYNFYAISLFAFFYNNKNTEFTLLEIKELYPAENIENNIEYLIKKGAIKKSKLGVESYKYNPSFTIPDIDIKYLGDFIKTFLFTRSLLYSVENDFQKKKEVYKEKIDIMNKSYKAFFKLSKTKNTKKLISSLGKVLLSLDPNIIKIELTDKKNSKTLYISPYFSNNNIIFPIKLGYQKMINIYLEPTANTELWFSLEPIIKTFYKNASYIDKIKKYLIKIKVLDKIRNFFLSNISHEIRTPLTPIKGYISFLKSCKEIKEEDLKEALLSMEDSYKRLEKIINNIIEIKNLSIENNKKDDKKEVISIKNVLDIVIQDNLNNINKKNIELLLNLNDNNDINIEVEIRKIRIALDAIIDNAIKFNRENGKIFIYVLENKRHVIIKVKDTGIGIPKNEIKKVFEPFFQKELNDKKRYEGLGLGLSIANEIIKREGGKIKIRSKEGKGTIVYIYLKKP